LLINSIGTFEKITSERRIIEIGLAQSVKAFKLWNATKKVSNFRETVPLKQCNYKLSNNLVSYDQILYKALPYKQSPNLCTVYIVQVFNLRNFA
jgi:hypothetical protein